MKDQCENCGQTYISPHNNIFNCKECGIEICEECCEYHTALCEDCYADILRLAIFGDEKVFINDFEMEDDDL